MPAWISATSAILSGQAAKEQTLEQVSAVLCFSEYYNGKWQPAKTSDTAAPVNLGVIPAGTFPRSAVALRPWTAADPSDTSLYVQVTSSDNFPSGPWCTSDAIDPGLPQASHLDGSARDSSCTTPTALLCAGVTSAGRANGPTGGKNPHRLAHARMAKYGTSKSGKDGYTNTDFNGLSSRADPQRPAAGDARWPPSKTLRTNGTCRSSSKTHGKCSSSRPASSPHCSTTSPVTALPPTSPWPDGIIPAIPPLVVPRPPVPGGPVLVPTGLADPGLAQRALLSTGTLRAALASTGSLTFQGRQIGAAGSIGSTQQRPGIAAEKKGQP